MTKKLEISINCLLLDKVENNIFYFLWNDYINSICSQPKCLLLKM